MDLWLPPAPDLCVTSVSACSELLVHVDDPPVSPAPRGATQRPGPRDTGKGGCLPLCASLLPRSTGSRMRSRLPCEDEDEAADRTAWEPGTREPQGPAHRDSSQSTELCAAGGLPVKGSRREREGRDKRRRNGAKTGKVRMETAGP